MKIPVRQNNSDSSKLFEELFQGLVKVLRQRERGERGTVRLGRVLRKGILLKGKSDVLWCFRGRTQRIY